MTLGADETTAWVDEAAWGSATETLPGCAEPAAIPTRIGRLQIQERLGAGGMGVVCAAHDEALERRVAVKLIRNTYASRRRAEEERRRLLREARAMARLSHPNVVEVYDAGTIDTHVYLSMELVVGQTLKQWLSAETRSWTEILAVFAQAGRGIAAAHGVGLVHRDFKPSNVLVARGGRVRVTDFGLARSARLGPTHVRTSSVPVGVEEWARDERTTLTGSDFAVGTPAYMPPEQHSRDSEPDVRADQFAFCAALYEALYGVRPFEGENAVALYIAKRDEDVVPPRVDAPRIPRRIHRAVMRGLSADPQRRWSSMAELLDNLRSVAPRRRRRLAFGLCGALVALASVGGIDHALASVEHAGPSGARARDASSSVERPVPVLLRDRMVEAEVLYDAANYPRAAVLAQEALAEARSEALPRWEARASLVLGGIRMAQGDVERARTRLTDALHIAEAQGDDRLAARAASQLGLLLGTWLGRPVDGLRWVRHAEVSLDRIAPDDLLRARVLYARGQVLRRTAEVDAAIDALEEALRLCSGVSELVPVFAISIQVALGNALAHRGEHDRAIGLLRRSLDDARARQGSRHPQVGQVAFDLSVALQHRGEWDEVESLRRQALEVLENSLGPEHPMVARALRGIGDAMLDTGRRGEGEPYYRRALEITQRGLGEQESDHPMVIQLTERLAQSLAHRGEVDEAVVLLHRAAAMARRIGAPSDEYRVRRVLLWMLEAAGRDDQLHLEADALADDLRQTPDPDRAGSRENRALWANTLWRRGRVIEAVPVYQALVEELEGEGPSAQLTGYRFDLARVRWEAGAEGEGLAQARRALSGSRGTEGQDDLQRSLERWLGQPQARERVVR